MKTSITFLKSRLSREETVNELMKTDADYIHVDIMDGKFVPREVLSIKETIDLFKDSKKPLDVHLMVDNPLEYIRNLANLNIACITIHAEISRNIDELINYIHSLGINAGLAICAETSVSSIAKYLDHIECILIMGVTPGYGGQKMIPETVDKIAELCDMRDQYNYHYKIAFDGGVNQETKNLLTKLDIIVAGSYVCESLDYQATINTLKEN